MQQLIVAALSLSVAWFVISTIHWPLVGDASLMHYVAFLMDHHRVPYREIADMNFPASYLPDWTVEHLFGTSALSWRLYDLGLLGLAVAAMAVIARPSGWFPAAWAGCLFALIHGRDGLNQVGQRDLTAGVLLLTGTAWLLWGTRRPEATRQRTDKGEAHKERIWPAGLFGACAGLAAMIKPTLAPFLLLVLSDLRPGQRIDPAHRRRIALAFSCWLLPICMCLLWLRINGGLSAFWYDVTILDPYHRSLGYASLHDMVRNGLSPITPILIVWLTVLVLHRLRKNPPSAQASLPNPQAPSERRTLLFAVLLGAASYLVQWKGYPYHRYPLLLFLLPLIAIDLTNALATATGALQALAAGILLWAGLGLGPSSALKASRYDWRNEEFRLTLQSDLQQAARSLNQTSLYGKVQCLDTISGCINTLYDMQLAQASDVLYDEFLFHPSGTRAVDDARATFWTAMQANPPLVFIVSDPLFPTGPNHYAKLAQWPEFSRWLDRDYELEVERHPSQQQHWVGQPIIPLGYRLYIRRTALSQINP